MFGAIIGDIIGSKFEFDRGPKSKEFELFSKQDCFTDDTVMTTAVAEALLQAGNKDEKEFKKILIRCMKKWGKRYPYAGYGGRFIHWVLSNDTKPYGSYGNGSAMRVSPVGWYYDTIERTREVARWTAEVTHNHPEGVKGAESVAAAIFMARNGASKKEIKAYIKKEFGYKLNRSLAAIAPGYHHVEDCMHSVPEAMTCFLEGENYEDTIRNVMFIGGDTDTLGAIAGAIAEAAFGIPVDILKMGRSYLEEDIEGIMKDFYGKVGTGNGVARGEQDEEFSHLDVLQRTCAKARASKDDNDFAIILMHLVNLMRDGAEAVTQMRDVSGVLTKENLESIIAGAKVTMCEEAHLQFDYLMNTEKKYWIPLFTSREELSNGPGYQISTNMPIEAILREAIRCDIVEGVVINPYSTPIALYKDVVKKVCEMKDMNGNA